MKFGICNEMFEGWEIEKVFAYAAEAGYHGVEIAPFTLADDCRTIPAERRQAIREAAAASGVEIIGLHWLLVKPEGLHLNSPDAAVREETVNYLTALVDFCADIGGTICVFGSPQQRDVLPPESFIQAWQRSVKILRRVSEAAGARGVVIAFEPLTSAETNFITSMAEGQLLVEAVNHPAFRLHLDVKAMCGEGRPPAETIRLSSGQHVAHVHVNDPNLRGPGMGKVDFAPVAAALREIGYDGYVSVEVFDFEPGAETTATTSMETLKQHFGQADT